MTYRGSRVEGRGSRVEGKLFVESRKKNHTINEIYRGYLHGQKEGHSPRSFMLREWKLVTRIYREQCTKAGVKCRT